MEPKNRLGGADGVRALACLLVLAHHACQRLDLAAQPAWLQTLQSWLLTGSAGVAVFFVLSGFLLAQPFWRAWLGSAGRPGLGSYALRRWARIAPAFWVNLSLTFALSFTFAPEAPERLWRYLAGLTFTSSLTWQTIFPVEINGPLWSIGFEVFSYTLLGLAMLLWFRIPGPRTLGRGLAFWAAVAAAALAAHGALLAWGQPDAVRRGWEFGMFGGGKYWWPAYSPFGFFAIFLMGTAAAGVAEWLGRNPPARGRVLLDLAAAGALAGAAVLTFLLRQAPDFALSWPKMPYYFPVFPALFAVVLACGPSSLRVGRWLDNRPARYLARISFGLYIWHYLLLEASQLIWPDLHYMGVRDAGSWLLRIGALYLTAGLIAAASWRWFEKPIVTWSQNRRRIA